MSNVPGYIEGPRKKRLLYIEDDRTNQVVVKPYFEQKGYAVDVAGDAIQALVRVINRRYDAIILDFHLPILSAEEAEHALRKARVPRVYYTYDKEAADSRTVSPVVRKETGSGPDETGLRALERAVADVMAEPLPDDYDKTQHISASMLEEIRRGPHSLIKFPAPESEPVGRLRHA